MTIRQYAKQNGIQVAGKLTRMPEYEYNTDLYTGEKKWSGYKFYIDDAGNEFHVGKRGVCIVTHDGNVI